MSTVSLKCRLAGSVLFHFSLLLVIGTAIMNYLFHFRGDISLTEGQTVQDSARAYSRIDHGPFWSGDYRRFTVRMDGTDAGFRVGESFTHAADLSFRSEQMSEPVRSTIRINHPGDFNGLEFHMVSDLGYSPELFVQDSMGASVFRGFVRLNIGAVGDRTVHRDFLLLPEFGMRVDMEVVPPREGIDAMSRMLRIERDDKLHFDGPVLEGEVISSGGFLFSFPETRRYCHIGVVFNPYQAEVFVAFWLSIASLLLVILTRMNFRKGNHASS